jgi:CRP-like cAMP-binding protein
MTDRLEALANVPLFAPLSKRALRRIGKDALDYRYEPGHVVIEQGEEGAAIFVILEGTARVVVNGRTRRRIGVGDFVGEIAVLNRRPRTARVVAETDLRCLVLHREDLRTILKGEPAVAWEMLSELATRIAGD